MTGLVLRVHHVITLNKEQPESLRHPTRFDARDAGREEGRGGEGLGAHETSSNYARPFRLFGPRFAVIAVTSSPSPSLRCLNDALRTRANEHDREEQEDLYASLSKSSIWPD